MSQQYSSRVWYNMINQNSILVDRLGYPLSLIHNDADIRIQQGGIIATYWKKNKEIYKNKDNYIQSQSHFKNIRSTL